LRRREIAIGEALIEDGLGSGAMEIDALRLLVLLVPPKIQPPQALEDGIEGGLGVALHVRVVDAQDHGPAVAAGVEPIEDEGTRAPDVEKARWGGRKADSMHENTSITGGLMALIFGVLVYCRQIP